jgi:hypothetical protein
MTPERWRQIEELYHAAREPSSVVLTGGDPQFRREVEILPAQYSGEAILHARVADLLREETVT